MEAYIIEHDNVPMTTSLKVAEVFGKNHQHVMRDIRDLIEKGLSNFGPSSYVNAQNKQQPMFLMDRTGFTVLAMGFTGDTALEFKLKYIAEFDRMEAHIKEQSKPKFIVPQTMIEAMELALTTMKEKEALKAENAIMLPKATAYDQYMDAPDNNTTVATIVTRHEDSASLALTEEVNICGSGNILATVTQDNKCYFSPNHVCEHLGIDWSGQYVKIKADPVLSSTIEEISIVARDGKTRRFIMLPIEFLSGWLFTIKKVGGYDHQLDHLRTTKGIHLMIDAPLSWAMASIFLFLQMTMNASS